MKIRRITKVNTIRKPKNPALRGLLANAKVNKKSHISRDTFRPEETLEQIQKRLNRAIVFMSKGGLTYKNSLLLSKKIDIERAKKDLSTFMIRGLQQNVFKWIVKASGKYQETHHQVEFKFVDVPTLIQTDYTAKEIFLKTRLRTQCSCGRFKYWYRYIATKSDFVIGVQEHRFPKIRNAQLDGALCKHQIKVITAIGNNAFISRTFSRYIERLKEGRMAKLSNKDKVSSHSSSSRSSIKTD